MTLSEQSEQSIFVEKCRLFAELFEANRLEDLVAMFYTPDAILEGQGLSPQQGRAAICRVYEDTRTFCCSIDICVERLNVSSDIAYGCIVNLNRDIEGHVQTHRGMLIWRRIDQDWLVEHDFFFCEVEPTLLPGLSPHAAEFSIVSQLSQGI